MGWLRRVRAGLAAAERASKLSENYIKLCVEVGECRERVVALTEALVDQQRRNDEMAVEWATTLDKIGRWASRQSARERRDTHKTLDELGEPRGSKAVSVDPKDLTKPELRALAARMRMGGAGVSSNGAE